MCYTLHWTTVDEQKMLCTKRICEKRKAAIELLLKQVAPPTDWTQLQTCTRDKINTTNLQQTHTQTHTHQQQTL
jgi:hypothetical protein